MTLRNNARRALATRRFGNDTTELKRRLAAYVRVLRVLERDTRDQCLHARTTRQHSVKKLCAKHNSILTELTECQDLLRRLG